MSPLAFAWRSLTRQPGRATLGIVGIMAVGALLFDMLLLSEGLALSFHDLLESTGFDVRATATQSLPGLGPPLADADAVAARLRELPEVDAVVPVVWDAAEASTVTASAVHTTLMGSPGETNNAWTILRGRQLPVWDGAGTPPVIVNENLAERLQLSLDSTLLLRGGTAGVTALPAAEFVVVGIADFVFDAVDSFTAATTRQGYHLAFGERGGDADMLLIVSDPAGGSHAAVEAIKELELGLNVFSNAQLVRRFQTREFTYFRQASFALSVMTLFFTFLLVATLLTVSVNQRFVEIAGLRALGFSRRRVVLELVAESALFVGIGGLLALPAGLALAQVLDEILRSLPTLPRDVRFFVFQPKVLVLHAALLGGAGMLAALYPVYLAARLPIAATLRREVIS